MIIDTNLCPICQREEETTVHVLWNCLATTDVWIEIAKPIQKLSTDGVDFMSLWKKDY